jgi:trimeric autotransporter adhesin
MNRLALPHAFVFAGVLFPICIGASQSAIAQTANPAAVPQQQRPAVKVTIKGTVHTPEGVAAPGAALRLLDVTSGRAWDTATDHEGKFTARDLPAGHYHIEAHQLGLGTAVWENDIYSSSPGAGSVSVQIELTFQRRIPLVQPTNAGVAATTRAPLTVGSNQSANASQKSGKSKDEGSEQIDRGVILTASQSEIAPIANVNALAQQQPPASTVTIRGRVYTPQRLAVPGAAVRLLDVASGKAWETSTDDDGAFYVPDVPAGRYRIEARQLGLGTAVWENDIRGSSSGTPSTSEQIELTLQGRTPVGQPRNSVAASKGAPLTTAKSPNNTNAAINLSTNKKSQNTNAAASGESDTATKKNDNSKKDGFETLEPTGVLTANSDPAQQVAPSAPPAISSNTQSVSADSYLISGAVGRGSTAATTDPNAQDDSASPDDTSSKSSKHHHSHGSHSKSKQGFTHAGPSDNLAGGVADLAVRDKIKHLGSNQLHLTLYNYYDNSAWDARNYALTGVPLPKIAHFNERFGANLGGPLTIPKLYNGKDRTFWFMNYEVRRRTDAEDLFENVPTIPERSGNFCDRGIQLFDPLTALDGPRQSFGCALPTPRLDPTALKLIPLIPPPNLAGFILNYHRGVRIPTSTDIVNFRLLHSISPRFSILGLFNLVQARGTSITSFPSLSGNAATRDQNVTLGLTQNWTPRLLNETKVNFNRNRNQIFSTNAFTNNVAAQDGITGVSTAPIDYGVPLISFANLTELADPAPLLVRNQTLRLLDNISYTQRRHNIRVGGEIRRRQLNTYTDPTARGVYSFSGLMTSQLDASGHSNPATGFDFADFLLGLPETTTVKFGTNSNYGRSWQFVSYAQDDWRVTPRFSVNYGARYELYTPFVEKNNHLANLLVNSSITQVAVAVPGQPDPFGGTLPNSLIRPQYANVAPRVGIAWKPFKQGGPVVRAGYGMFYNGSIYDGLFSELLNQPPWAQSRTLVTPSPQLLTLANGFPPSRLDTVDNIYGADPNYKVGYAQIWNFSLEQQFGKSYVVEFLYMGTKGTHLDLVADPNQATPGSIVGSDQRRRIPNAPGFSYETSGADSIYNGVQARLQKRMSNGMRFQFLYTLGHSIDDASVIGVGHISGLVQDYNNLRAERGNSFFDIRHDVRAWFYYDLPFGDRRLWLRSGIGSKLLGNWHVSANTLYNSGNHLTPYITAQNTNGVGPLFSQRPDQIGDPNLPAGQRTNGHFFNVSAFALPPIGSFGNAARGSIVGPQSLALNAALGRRMHFGPDGRYQFEIRWEVQNVTNTANFSNVVTVIDAEDAGVVTGAKSMRSMDILLRLRF